MTVHLYCHPHKQTQGRTEVGTVDLLLYPQFFKTCLQFLVPETETNISTLLRLIISDLENRFQC